MIREALFTDYPIIRLSDDLMIREALFTDYPIIR